MTRVLLVADRAAIREPLAFVLEREPGITLVNQAASPGEAIHDLAAADVAVVAVDRADEGTDVVRDLLTAAPGRVLAIVTSDSAPAAPTFAAAAAVLPASAPLADLLEALHRLAATIPPELADWSA